MPKNTAPKGLPALFQPIDLTEGPCWKTILRFSFPIILSYLLQQVYSISDAAIVGQTLSGEQVAGVNDIAPIVNIFLQFAFGVSAGFCVITSCNVGSHNQPGVRRSLATQIVLSAVLTLLLTALALALLNPMLAWINVTPDSGAVYTAAFTYCAIIFAGIGAQLFYNFICSFLRAMGDSVTPLMFLLFSTVLNVGLDLLFILSFGWGVAGAAIATVLAQLISTVACFLYAFPDIPSCGFTGRTSPSRKATFPSTSHRAFRWGFSFRSFLSVLSRCKASSSSLTCRQVLLFQMPRKTASVQQTSSTC